MISATATTPTTTPTTAIPLPSQQQQQQMPQTLPKTPTTPIGTPPATDHNHQPHNPHHHFMYNQFHHQNQNHQQQPHQPHHDQVQQPHYPHPTQPPTEQPPLPPHLAPLGWRLHWSKREARYYYFNSNTNESLWEMPRIAPQGGSNLYSDPLGIQQLQLHPTLKRPSTETLDPTSCSPPKRQTMMPMPPQVGAPTPLLLLGPWDLEIPPTHLITLAPKLSQISVYNLIPSHPEIEILRVNYCEKLKSVFLNTCKSREGVEIGAAAGGDNSEGGQLGGGGGGGVTVDFNANCGFEGYLLSQKLVDPNYTTPLTPSTTPPPTPTHDHPLNLLPPLDPLIPSPVPYSTLTSTPSEYPLELFESILNEIPVRVTGVKPRFTGDARKLLWKFTEGCRKIIEVRASTPLLPPTTIKHIKWTLSSTFQFLNSTSPSTPYDHFIERLDHLKTEILPHVHKAAEGGVGGICKKVTGVGRGYVENEIWGKLQSVLTATTEEGGSEKIRGQEGGGDGLIYGQPKVVLPTVYYKYTPIYTPTPSTPLVEYLHPTPSTVLIKYKTETVKISVSMLQKLDTLYKLTITTPHNSTPHDDPSSTLFLFRVYVLLKRYQPYLKSPLPFLILPPSVSEYLNKNFNVEVSLGSNPFTTYYRAYSGVYLDVEGWFGGTSFELKAGVGVVTPLWIPGVIKRVVEKCLEMVERVANTSTPHNNSNSLESMTPSLTLILILPASCPTYPSNSNQSIDYLTPLLNSKLNLTHPSPYLTLSKFEHEYKIVKISSSNLLVNWRSTVDTVVVVLSSSCHYSKGEQGNSLKEFYGGKLRGLGESWKIGRERERDRVGGLWGERAKVGESK